MGENPKLRRAMEPIVENRSRQGGIARLLILGLTLAAIAVLIYLFGKERLGEPLVLAILGGLAGIGVFFLFSLSLGFLSLTATRRDEAFTRSLVDSMDAGLQVSDAKGRIVYANRAYAELTGAADSAALTSVEALFSRRPESAEPIYRMANALHGGKASTEEVRLSAGLRAGEEGARWFRLRARPMVSEGDGETYSVWQVTDITTERLRQEDAFQELQNAINYLDHAPAGFFASEADHALVYLNSTLADWLGIDLARFTPASMNLSDIVPGEGMALIRSIKPAAGAAQVSVIDLDMAKSDGTRLPVRLYHRVALNPDGAAGSARTLVINRLVGEDSHSSADAEMRFTRFFNDTPFAIATLAGDGSVRQTNASFHRLFARLIQDRGGNAIKLSDLGVENEQVALEAAWEAALTGQARIDAVDITIPGDKGRFGRLLLSPVSNSKAHEGERAIAYVVETTQQRALEEQFAQSQKMQAVGQLAGGVAHDFNNVLTAIIGFSDLLLGTHRPSDPSFQDILAIKQNANRAASLVRQLLAFSRRQTLRPQVLQLSDVLSDLRMLLDRLLGERVELNVVHGRDVWPVKADLSQFETVIINLAVNARDAMPNGGKVTIRTANVTKAQVAERHQYKGLPEADYVLIEVEDEGVGMTRDVMDKIFEPFFSTKEVGKGTGLGLSTVYGIVKQTGGFIYPESEPGLGSLFRLFLPRHIAPARPAEDDRAAAPAAPGKAKRDLTGSARILLVEDEDAVRAFALRALKTRGFEVHEASTGVEALEKMAEIGNAIDIVVSDVVMPEMDGPTLLRELRKTMPGLKFIFMSGYAEEAFARNLPNQENEQFGFLPKPFTLKQLITKVKEVLEE